MGIILASASPRRRDLLEMLGFRDVTILPAPFEEECSDLDAAKAVISIALGKARYAAQSVDGPNLIIAADTLVYIDGEPVGKPRDEDDAGNMLRRLSGRTHKVYTGVALINDGMEITGSEETDVYFRKISDREIDAYIKTGEPMDKAGAYGAQGLGAIFIEKINGDFFNVMGLPLNRLSIMLAEAGIEIL